MKLILEHGKINGFFQKNEYSKWLKENKEGNKRIEINELILEKPNYDELKKIDQLLLKSIKLKDKNKRVGLIHNINPDEEEQNPDFRFVLCEDIKIEINNPDSSVELKGLGVNYLELALASKIKKKINLTELTLDDMLNYTRGYINLADKNFLNSGKDINGLTDKKLVVKNMKKGIRLPGHINISEVIFENTPLEKAGNVSFSHNESITLNIENSDKVGDFKLNAPNISVRLKKIEKGVSALVLNADENIDADIDKDVQISKLNTFIRAAFSDNFNVNNFKNAKFFTISIKGDRQEIMDNIAKIVELAEKYPAADFEFPDVENQFDFNIAEYIKALKSIQNTDQKIQISEIFISGNVFENDKRQNILSQIKKAVSRKNNDETNGAGGNLSISVPTEKEI